MHLHKITYTCPNETLKKQKHFNSFFFFFFFFFTGIHFHAYLLKVMSQNHSGIIRYFHHGHLWLCKPMKNIYFLDIRDTHAFLQSFKSCTYKAEKILKGAVLFSFFFSFF